MWMMRCGIVEDRPATTMVAARSTAEKRKVRRVRVAGLHLPKEHGAWAMLYVPFTLGVLVAARAGVATLWVLLAITALFFARETLSRLRRARGKQRPAAELWRALAVEAGVLVVSGGLLLFLHALVWFAPLGLLALLLLAFNLEQTEQREERNVAAQLMAIVGFAMAAPAAHYAALARWQSTALWLWALSWAYFASSVFHVKVVVLGAQPQRRLAFTRLRRAAGSYHAALAAALVFVVASGLLSPLVLCAYAPVMARALWSLRRRPARLVLRRIGMLEIVYSLNFLFFATLALRST